MNDTFRNLFGGGKASLILEDENDILNTGIDIDVQPPGKSVKSIRLFSGGEKTLIALCVLFTIIKVKPAPLIIFDEVEAALDQANVERFAKYVKRFEDIQTHRVKDVASVMILITGFIGITASEIPKHLFSGLLIGGILFICAVASNNRIGGADVKLSAACSFLLGFQRGMAGLVIGLLSAIICNLILNRKSKIKGKAFPLVPYLSVGFMIMYFF